MFCQPFDSKCRLVASRERSVRQGTFATLFTCPLYLLRVLLAKDGPTLEHPSVRFVARYFNITMDKYYVPIRIAIGTREGVVPYPMFLPHEILATLASLGEPKLKSFVCGSDGWDGVLDFWNHVAHLEWAKSHPAYDEENRSKLKYMAPAALFADEGLFPR